MRVVRIETAPGASGATVMEIKLSRENKDSSRRRPVFGAALISLIAAAGIPSLAFADEGGVSFWLPGTFDSFAALPDQPGWAFSATYYHASASAGASVAAARTISIGALKPGLQVNLAATTHQTQDSLYLEPGYVFATPVLGGQAAVSVSTVLARSGTAVDGSLSATLGPLGAVRSFDISDSVIGFGDINPQATLKWNRGLDNFMVYGTGGIPVGAYQSTRLSNIGLGYGAMDVGGGYTYYNDDSGYEFSAIAGVTYNLLNTSTNYQSGVDFHLDWAAARYLTEKIYAGPVGYFYEQLSCDGGSGDRVGCFESRVTGLGAEVTYSFPVGKLEGDLTLKGYGEFAAENRPSGWNLWLTFSVSPAEPAQASARAALLHK